MEWWGAYLAGGLCVAFGWVLHGMVYHARKEIEQIRANHNSR